MLNRMAFDAPPALRDEQRRIEAATFYIGINQFKVADALLGGDAGSASAIALYLAAWVAQQEGATDRAVELRSRAAANSVECVMPSRLEELAALEAALQVNDEDANARYLAGLVLYFKNRVDEARDQWQRAIEIRDDNAMAHRCLAVTLDNDRVQERCEQLARAVELAPDSAQLYADIDDAYRRAGQVDQRVQLLEQATRRLPRRTDLAHRLGKAYFDAGRYDDAVFVYRSRRFHVAENRYSLHGDYSIALNGRAMEHLAVGQYLDALVDLNASSDYPDNLNIGRSSWNDVSGITEYWRGVALDRMGQHDQAVEAWQQAARQDEVHRWMEFSHPERLAEAIHAAMAQQKLGEDDKAKATLERVLQRCDDFEGEMPPQSNACANLCRAFVAAVRGQDEESAELMRKLEAGSQYFAGELRLMRLWLAMCDVPEAPATVVGASSEALMRQ